MKKNDYLIFKTFRENQDTVYHLGQAVKPTSEGLLVDLEKDRHFNPQRVEIPKESIVLNLGQDPEPGNVYGQNLSHLYRGSVDTGYGIEFHKFSKFSKEAEQLAIDGTRAAIKILKHHGLFFTLELPVVYELKQKVSKYAGWFKPGRDMSKITLFAADTTKLEFNSYVILHELSHAIDHYLLTSKNIRAKWVKLYMTSVQPTTVSLAEARAMWKPFKASESVGNWKSAFEDDTAKAKTNLILRSIKQANKLGPKDINVLMAADEFEVLKSLWPTEDLHSTDLNPIITEYATRSVQETIAESLSLYLTGKSLPKGVVSLVEETIQHAMGNKGRGYGPQDN